MRIGTDKLSRADADPGRGGGTRSLVHLRLGRFAWRGCEAAAAWPVLDLLASMTGAEAPEASLFSSETGAGATGPLLWKPLAADVSSTAGSRLDAISGRNNAPRALWLGQDEDQDNRGHIDGDQPGRDGSHDPACQSQEYGQYDDTQRLPHPRAARSSAGLTTSFLAMARRHRGSADGRFILGVGKFVLKEAPSCSSHWNRCDRSRLRRMTRPSSRPSRFDCRDLHQGEVLVPEGTRFPQTVSACSPGNSCPCGR